MHLCCGEQFSHTSGGKGCAPEESLTPSLPVSLATVAAELRLLSWPPAKLPGTARMVVWMHCIEGFTHEEIGRTFGYTASFSKTQLARAYAAMADARFGAVEQSDESETVCGA